MGLESLLSRAAREKPDAPALVFEGREIGYAEADRMSNRVANGLKRLGISRGDRVAIMLPNVPEFVYTLIGTTKLGAVAVPFNTMYKGGEVAHILKDSGAKALVALSSFAPLVNEVLPLCPELRHVVYTGERNISFAEPEATVFLQMVFDARGRDLDDTYRKVGASLLKTLEILGVKGAWYCHRGSVRSADGRKLGGFLVSEAEGLFVVNSQLFAGKFSPDRFMEAIWVPHEIKDKVVEPLSSIEEAVGRKPAVTEVKAAAEQAFGEVFGADFKEAKMTRDELFGYEKMRSQAFRKA